MTDPKAIPQGYMTVGEVAKKMGVTVRTLQFYDREGLLCPSAVSEGGRRLYADKDIIKLHQILSLKSLGFSLGEIKNKLTSIDTPDEVAAALTEQSKAIQAQIDSLTQSLHDLETLKTEVLKMQSVDFKKYADIIVNLQMRNDNYWLIKYFDDNTLDFLRGRFDKESGLAFINKFNALRDRAVQYSGEGLAPASAQGQELAKEFWQLITEFTGGDMSLLPQLMKMGKLDTDNAEWQEKMDVLNAFISPALEAYFRHLGINPFEVKMADALQVKGLKKSYGEISVLKGLDFSVKQGEIFALLGVNGAGKTTALECIEGLRSCDDGEITKCGKIGIQLQSASLQAFIKPLEAVDLFSKWNKTKPDEKMLEALGIYELAKKKYADLSTGQKRRLHLALALIGDPDLLFLDEPTAGLDVEARSALHAQIKGIKAQGKTIILASHDMAEVETLCDRLAILKDGKIAFIGTTEELTAAVGKQYTVHITTSTGRQSFVTDDLTQTLLEKISECKDKNIEISDIRTDRGTLEQHFLDIARNQP